MFRIDPVSRYFARAARGVGPLVLMYHAVSPGRARPEWTWSVALGRFEEQIDLLRAAGWRFCKVSELVKGLEQPERCIAVSFDDGYANNFPAFEVLARRGLPGTWFIVSANVGQPAAWKDDTTAGWPMLDAGQLHEMVNAGMEIGGHTRHHCRLAEAPPEQLDDEIAGCRQELEDLLGQSVPSFAYPYGSHDDAVVEAARRAGFDVACVTRAGPAWADGDAMRVRRLAVYAHDNLSSFGRKIGLARNEATWGRVFEHMTKR
jgi:peptidoglycan/xylan/chitin deacetylase (PgdA/CDA1 family)